MDPHTASELAYLNGLCDGMAGDGHLPGRIIPGFSHGFTSGIRKMQELLPLAIQDYRRQRKRFPSSSHLDEIFRIAIVHRALFREDPDAFIRYNAKGYFEAYTPHRKEGRIR